MLLGMEATIQHVLGNCSATGPASGTVLFFKPHEKDEDSLESHFSGIDPLPGSFIKRVAV